MEKETAGKKSRNQGQVVEKGVRASGGGIAGVQPKKGGPFAVNHSSTEESACVRWRRIASAEERKTAAADKITRVRQENEAYRHHVVQHVVGLPRACYVRISPPSNCRAIDTRSTPSIGPPIVAYGSPEGEKEVRYQIPTVLLAHLRRIY